VPRVRARWWLRVVTTRKRQEHAPCHVPRASARWWIRVAGCGSARSMRHVQEPRSGAMTGCHERAPWPSAMFWHQCLHVARSAASAMHEERVSAMPNATPDATANARGVREGCGHGARACGRCTFPLFLHCMATRGARGR